MSNLIHQINWLTLKTLYPGLYPETTYEEYDALPEKEKASRIGRQIVKEMDRAEEYTAFLKTFGKMDGGRYIQEPITYESKPD